MTEKSTFPLQLSRSNLMALEAAAKEDGVSINQVINVAVAEKIATLRTVEYFRERASRADLAEFDRILNRQGGEPPRPGDEMPS